MKDPLHRKRLRFAYARISVITLLSLLCAGGFISVTNDLYAFVKPDREETLLVTAPQSLRQTAQALEDRGIVRNPAIFEWYVRSKGSAERIEAFSGELKLNAAMSYREILLAFKESQKNSTE